MRPRKALAMLVVVTLLVAGTFVFASPVAALTGMGETPTPTNTPAPPTDTPVPPTDTPVPPTDTPVPPTDTPVPPTETPAPLPTDAPPTETPAPAPTDVPPTSVPPTDTPAPEAASTATPAPALPATGQSSGPNFLATALLAFGVLFACGGGLLLWRALTPGQRSV